MKSESQVAGQGKALRWLSTTLLLLSLTAPVSGQVNSGAAFLKLLPGARHQGMAGTLTGVIDDMHAVYANPAAAGFLREWQWATTYTEWIADSYQLSLSYGRQWRNPLTRRIGIAIGLQYQGVREFDSTKRLQPAASANDFLMSLSVGQPVPLASGMLSLGASAKYFRSNLASFGATTWAYDVGALFRSRRRQINVPLVDYLFLAGGIALTNFGKPLTFVNSETPLPRTFRAGVSVNAGSHRGLQFQLSTELRKVRDERVQFNVGTELSWNYRFALRGGYNLAGSSLDKLSFGLSIRLDDHASPLKRVPGRNKALRVDFAGTEKKEIFQTTYQAGVNYFPTTPESFDLQAPLSGVNIEHGRVEFVWTVSQDPDLYDDLGYLFMLERLDRDASESRLWRTLNDLAGQEPPELRELVKELRPHLFALDDVTASLFIDRGKAYHRRDDLVPGDYRWAVIAFDRDSHYRIAGKGGLPIGDFKILPDLYITDMQFSPSPWISDDDYQGELSITIANKGKATAPHATIQVVDSLLTANYANAINGLTQHGGYGGNGASNGNHRAGNGHTPAPTLDRLQIVNLRAGRDTTLVLPWHTERHGLHRLEARIDPADALHEFDETNNRASDDYYTIPRGVFRTGTKVITQIDSLYEYELPFIPKIYFAPGSAKLEDFGSSLIYSPLEVLAQRFKQTKGLHLKLQGSVDLENGEPRRLARQRAQAVKQALIGLGIDEAAIEIPERVSVDPRLLGTSAETRRERNWVNQERRFVRITAARHDRGREDVRLFYSVPVQLPKSKTFLPVQFQSTITGFVPAVDGNFVVYSDTARHAEFEFVYAGEDTHRITWTLSEAQRRTLQNARVSYHASVKDALGREFRTPPANALLATEKRNLLDEKIIIGVAEFRQEKPGDNLYWASVARKVSERLANETIQGINFVGHACAIGDSVYNQELSVVRAQNFYEEFARRFPKLMRRIQREFHQVGVFGEGENSSYRMEVDRKLFLETLRKHNLQDFNHVTYELVGGRKYNRKFPLTFRLDGDQIIIETDNNTPFGRQINRRIEILVQPVERDLPRLSQDL